jgi:two-component system, NtrC family, sensor kinase
MNKPLSQSPEPLTVLVVDDTPANVAVLADYLEDQGLRIVVAQDGQEALKRAEFVRPDLILLDVMMPGMDGFETCRHLKNNPSICDIPVIFMTAFVDAGSVMKGFRLGAVDYVTKPIQIEEVEARIRTHLALRTANKQLNAKNMMLEKEVEIRLLVESALKEAGAEQGLLIAKLREAHEQLLQSEKMASVGQLAAGIAHEINNPIGFLNSNVGTLQGYLETLFETLDACSESIAGSSNCAEAAARFAQVKNDAEIDFLRSDVTELMRESKEGLKRVKDIVQSLKDFSHVGEANWLEADIHRGLDSTLNIVNNEIKYKATVVREYGELPVVRCLASQLNQVFMNLLVNAAQAIEKYGTITIRTGHANDWVWVEISDTGSGIPPEILNRIFDPFFTTKPIGSGTGLGLSLSYGIVNKHGGRIEVKSEVNKGTSFTVHLPVNPVGSDGGAK